MINDSTMGIIELTVRACIHLVSGILPFFTEPILGSGVIVQYKGRYFIISVAHFTMREGRAVGILTGRRNGDQGEIYQLGDFSYMQHIYFEDEPDADDLQMVLDNFDPGGRLDISFREIPLVENLIQEERIFNLDERGEVRVERGAKSFLVIDHDFEVDREEVYSFFGRIRPLLKDGILNFEEKLYWGLPITNISEYFIEFDLGKPILDYTRFKGCSGTPILDSQGRFVAILTHGSKLHENMIYGFRADLAKRWIELMYFQPLPDPAAENNLY